VGPFANYRKRTIASFNLDNLGLFRTNNFQTMRILLPNEERDLFPFLNILLQYRYTVYNQVHERVGPLATLDT
jgi:hypothetical protein